MKIGGRTMISERTEEQTKTGFCRRWMDWGLVDERVLCGGRAAAE
jgi:hypothetical protein